MEQILSSQRASEGMARDILKFRLAGLKVDAIRVDRQELINLVEVSPAEINEFVQQADNQKLLSDMYQEAFARFNKPEEVKARHILLRIQDPSEEATVKSKAEELGRSLSAKNFAEKAKQFTEDPSGKNNGGDLGWFSRGRMVPEFENAAFGAKPGQIVGPVKTNFGYHWIMVEGRKGEEVTTLEQAKPELAKLALQKRKSLDLEQLMTATKEKLEGLLKSSQKSAIDAEKKRMNLVFLSETEVNQYDLNVGPHNLTADEGQRLFQAQPGTVVDLSSPGALFLVKVISSTEANQDAKISSQLKAEVQSQSQVLSRQLREELLKELNAKAKVVTNPTLL
jgi:hypothetical protein